MLKLKFAIAAIPFLCIPASPVMAGDDASRPIHYSTDFSQPFTRYAMSERDNDWRSSLVKKLKYTGAVVHFVRTSLPLQVDKAIVQGAVYQGLERPDYFYVVDADAMLKLGARWACQPGVGGF